MANSPLNGGSLLNGGQQGGITSIANGGTGATTAAGARTNLGIPQNILGMSPYISGRFYLAGWAGNGTITTNTNLLVNDTLYGILSYIGQSVTISTIGFRTSSSNGSAGASIKFGIFAVDASQLPAGRLAMTTSGTAIADGAISTTYTGTLDTPVLLTTGTYVFACLSTAVTTGARATIYTPQNSSYTNGAATMANSLGSGGIMGYTGSASYASGIPATWGVATPVTNNTNHPALAFGV